MKRIFFLLLGPCAFLITALQSLAFVPPERQRLVDYDKRSNASSAASSSLEQTAAAAAFQSKSAHAQVHFDKVTGAPAHVAGREGFLSQPDPKTMAKDPYAPTRKFL